jgi:hypothetical protein
MGKLPPSIARNPGGGHPFLFQERLSYVNVYILRR